MSAVALLGTVLLIVWIVLVFFWHGFWRMDVRLPAAGMIPLRGGRWPSVVVLVPARNEEETLKVALSSLLAQDYPGDFHVIVINDNSTDATAEIAREMAATSHERLTAIDAPPRPAGWMGKMAALQAGYEHMQADPRLSQARYVWLTDADIRHDADALRRLVHLAEGERRDLVSALVRLHCESVWEKLLIPTFVYFFFLLYPPRAVMRPDRYAAGAAGGCLLLRKEALEDIGAFAAVHDAVIDDCAIARKVKDKGYRLWLGLTEVSRSLRAYPDLADLWRMIARSAYAQLAYSPLLLLLSLAGLLFAFVLPALYALGFIFGDAAAHFTGLVAFGLMTASMLPVIRFYDLARFWSLTLPVAAVLYGLITLSSALDHHRGKGISWRDSPS